MLEEKETEYGNNVRYVVRYSLNEREICGEVQIEIK